MTLEELGARLRERRMEQGFSIEDIASRLKVPPRVLKAIEEGRRDELPHAVYIRSFVKSGGALLGIAPDELAGMLAALDDGGAVPQPIRPKGMMESQMEGERGHGGGLLLKLLLLALIGVGGYVYYTTTYREEMPSVLRFGADRPVASLPESSPDSSGMNTPGAGTAEHAAPAEDMPRGTNAGAESAAENPWGEPAAPQVSGEDAVSQIPPTGEISPEPAPLGEAAGPEEMGTAGGADRQEESPATEGTESSAREENSPSAEKAPAVPVSSERWTLRSPAGTRHRLVISAREDCWLSASADADAARKGGTLRKGETFTAEFNDRLTLRLGNAGGVDVFYDGVRPTGPGKRGGVMTVTFPPR